MILSCPECNTRYLINSAQLLPNGRSVRCSKCGTSWRQEPTDEDKARAASLADMELRKGHTPDVDTIPVQDPPRRIRPIPRGSNLPAVRKPRKSPIWGWMMLTGFVVVVLATGYMFRNTISSTWPSSQKLYDVLGIEVENIADEDLASSEPSPSDVLEFKGLSAKPRFDGEILILTFEGRIENPSDMPIALPRVRAVAQDESGAPLKEWTFTVPSAAISANGRVTFSTDLPDAPSSTRRVVPNFITR